MDEGTARALNQLTRSYYEGSAVGFCAANELPSPGWSRVLQQVKAKLSTCGVPSILDLGCGVGRFVDTLEAELGTAFDYTGLDSSQGLIALADARRRDGVHATFRVADLVNHSLESELGDRKFQLIVAFGLLHHIPGLERRRSFVESLCRRVEHGGALALSTWRRRSDQGFRQKVVDWTTFNQEAGAGIDLSQVELGDHLVRKPGRGLRYCHFVHQEEADTLFSDLPLTVRADFTADGRVGHRNRYFVLH